MRRNGHTSRRKERQKLMRELAAEETILIARTSASSRAIEAIDALERIQQGTYGMCVDCGKEIPATRLAVKPEATRCVTCQTAHEQQSTAA